MPVFRNSNVSNVSSISNLLPVSLAFRELGCAVIPLVGGDDRHMGKRPAIRWSVYQTRLPYADELAAWFGSGRFSAYGVVCGTVSRLVVLDLDKSNLADDFAARFPHLMETLVVASGLRGTPHIYWRTDFRVESRAFPGGDLKAEGGYVVGPQSVVAGAAWSIVSDKPIRSIASVELAEVLDFLIPTSTMTQPVVASPGENQKPHDVGIASGRSSAKCSSSVALVGIQTSPTSPVPSADIVAFYNRRIDLGSGRNKSLFDVACRARDCGYSESQVLEILTPVHVAAPSPESHPRESQKARAAEATRTIKSAYSRPPSLNRSAVGTRCIVSGEKLEPFDDTDVQTQSNMPFDSSIHGANPFDSSIQAARLLPNAVRERLLARSDGAAILRTFEAALLSGISESLAITESELCRVLATIVSRKTIRKALAATYDGVQPIFARVESTQSPQTPHTLVDTDVEKLYRQKNALLSLGHEGTKVAHRPPRYFLMPTIKAICKGLGVKMTLSSPLTLADLSSSRGCRQALHADLLTRRPGLYSQNLLGARLGVTARTIRRYHQQMPVQSSKTYEETPISSHNLHRIPSGADIERMMLNVGGQFLMDSEGDKWPLKREIAAWLLKRGRRVSHMEQKANFYWMPDQLSVGIPTHTSAVSVGAQYIAPKNHHADAHHPAPINLSTHAPVNLPGYTPVTVAGESLLVRTHPSLSHHQMPLFEREGALMSRIPANGGVTRQNAGIALKTPNLRESRRKYHRPLADQRDEQLANRLWATIEDFSLMNARRLVTTYGVDAVEAALKKMLWLQAHGKIANPGGFMVTASRVSWRIQNRKTNLGDPAPRFRAEPRSSMSASQPVSF